MVCSSLSGAASVADSRFSEKAIKKQELILAKANWSSATNIQVHLTILLLLLISLTLPVASFFIDKRQSPALHEWSYARQHEWRLEHKQCGLNVQSPIDIQRRHVIPSSQLKLHFYNYNQPTKFKIQNAHHTIKLNPLEQAPSAEHFDFKRLQDIERNSSGGLHDFDDDFEPEIEHAPASARHPTRLQPSNAQAARQAHNQEQAGGVGPPLGSNQLEPLEPKEEPSEEPPKVAYKGAPTIKLDWLDEGNNEFKLRDIHFHWAERRDNGSEHAIDGRRAAMEMHLVHLKHGLDKSAIGFTSDSVAVIAVLIESYRKSNADFNPIVNALTRINMTEQTQEIEYKSIYDLLPNVLTSFYTYSGSLTTPPCYQVVNWIVMSDRLYLNAKQIEMFRNLYAPLSTEPHNVGASQQASTAAPQHLEGLHEEPTLMMPNIRRLQALNNRTILASFSPLSRLELSQSPYNSAKAQHNCTQLSFLICYAAFIRFAFTWIPKSLSSRRR